MTKVIEEAQCLSSRLPDIYIYIYVIIIIIMPTVYTYIQYTIVPICGKYAFVHYTLYSVYT